MKGASFIRKECIQEDIQVGEIFDTWRLNILSNNAFQALTKEEKLNYLAHFGILAPTTHNTVPQRYKFDQKKYFIELWLDRKYILPYSDAEGRQATISLGAVIANIKIAAMCYYLSTEIQLIREPSNKVLPYKKSENRYSHICNLNFKLNKNHLNRNWLKLMLVRKVIRSEYDERAKLSDNFVKDIKQYIYQKYPSLNIHIITDKIRLHGLAKFQEFADRTVIERNNFAYELGGWLLPNQDNETKVGMRGRESIWAFSVNYTCFLMKLRLLLLVAKLELKVLRVLSLLQ